MEASSTCGLCQLILDFSSKSLELNLLLPYLVRKCIDKHSPILSVCKSSLTQGRVSIAHKKLWDFSLSLYQELRHCPGFPFKLLFHWVYTASDWSRNFHSRWFRAIRRSVYITVFTSIVQALICFRFIYCKSCNLHSLGGGVCEIRCRLITWCGALRGCLVVKFDSCNNLLSFVDTMYVIHSVSVSLKLKSTKISFVPYFLVCVPQGPMTLVCSKCCGRYKKEGLPNPTSYLCHTSDFMLGHLQAFSPLLLGFNSRYSHKSTVYTLAKLHAKYQRELMRLLTSASSLRALHRYHLSALCASTSTVKTQAYASLVLRCTFNSLQLRKVPACEWPGVSFFFVSRSRSFSGDRPRLDRLLLIAHC